MKFWRVPMGAVLFWLMLFGSGLCASAGSLTHSAALAFVYTENAGQETETLLHIEPLSEPVEAAYGADKSAAGLSLPDEVRIKTTGKTKKALVLWNVKDCDYDPDLEESQTFTVTGQVLLPDNIENPEDLSLEVSAELIVDERETVVADEDQNRILGFSNGDRFTTQTRISFEAIGDQMDLEDPHAGDTRFVPSGWMVLENRFFEPTAPYEASFRIAKAGGFTLTVTFCLQKFDGEEWVNTGYQDEKYISFNVVPASDEDSENPGQKSRTVKASVDTADDTSLWWPILLLTLSGSGIILLLCRTEKREYE